MIRTIGIGLALCLTTTSVVGIGALILQDFPEIAEAAAQFLKAPELDDVEALLDGVDEITLFMRSRIEGSQIEVSTGASYPTARAVDERRSEKMWCYLAVGQGGVLNSC